MEEKQKRIGNRFLTTSEIPTRRYTFCIRADGNPRIGSGHIMRCLSLADALREAGHKAVFVMADSHLQNVVQTRGYECVILHTQFDHMEDELPAFCSVLEELRSCCAVLDSYFVTPNYMSAIKKELLLVYIDDLNAFDYPVDLIVNYALYADKLAYPKNKRCLLGPQYALLRREFQNIPHRRVAKQVRHVLLSTGGADSEHVAVRCVKYLLEKPTSGIIYHVVLGAMNQDMRAIEHLAAGQDHIVLHRQVSDMCSLMLQCDVAVSAAGTTLFELCACGIPAVTYVLADNQIMNAASFEEAGAMLCAGDIRKDGRFTARIFEQLDRLIQEQPLRKSMAERMRALVDGHGANCLAEAIVKELRLNSLRTD